MGNCVKDRIQKERVAVGKCPNPDCNVELEGHPKCGRCDMLVGRSHAARYMVGVICNLCHEDERKEG